ncbi:MAG TPA: hypothetical protein VHB21_13985 [Minicystis sp.]|nr:hypothetical protein [Minicystis sp.]
MCLAASKAPVVLRGDVADLVVANAEELTVQAMLTEVSIILAKMGGGLGAGHVDRFGEREGARSTPYRFDAAT